MPSLGFLLHVDYNQLGLLSPCLCAAPGTLFGPPFRRRKGACHLISLGKVEDKDLSQRLALSSLRCFCMSATEYITPRALCFNRKCQMFEQQRGKKKLLIFYFKYQERELKPEHRGMASAGALEGLQLQPLTGRQVSLAGWLPGLLPPGPQTCL